MSDADSHVWLEGWPTDGVDAQAHDVVCAFCGLRARLHPAESFLAQVQLFLGQHRHEDDEDDDEDQPPP